MEIATDSTSKKFRPAVIAYQSEATGSMQKRTGPVGVSGESSAATEPIRRSAPVGGPTGAETAASLREELLVHQRILAVAATHDVPSSAVATYVRHIDALARSVQGMSGASGVAALLPSLVMGRMHLLANIESFDEWMAMAKAIFPDDERIQVPVRFIGTHSLEEEKFPDVDSLRILDKVQRLVDSI